MKTILVATTITVLLATACGGAQQAAVRTPDSIVAAFKAAGLEAEAPAAMAKDDYGAAPMVAHGLRFLIPSLGADKGGRAFVGTKAEINQLRDFYEGLGKQSALLFSWVFVSPDGTALVQINGDLPQDQALKYEQALK